MKKSKKNFFLGQIGLQFLVAHWSACNSTGFGLASLDRETFCGQIGSSIEKIRRGEDLHLKSKRRKTSTRGRLGTARTLLPGKPIGLLEFKQEKTNLTIDITRFVTSSDTLNPDPPHQI